MKPILSLGIAAGLALAIPATCAFAHGDHGGGGGTILPAGVTLVTLEYDVTTYKPLTDEQLKAAEPGPHAIRRISVPSLSVAYGLTPNLTIAARLPYLSNQDIKELSEDDPTIVADRGGVHGIGDLSVTGTWRFYQDVHRGFEAALIFGVKTPTGKTDAVDVFGERFETHHQPGSGSWDAIVGGTVSQQLTPANSVTANVLYVIAGDGTADTNVGDRLGYGVTLTHRLWSSHGASAGHMHLGAQPDGIMHHGGLDHSAPSRLSSPETALHVSLGLNGQWSDKVQTAGIVDPDTGGTVLSVTPGLRLSIGNWASYVNVGVPVAKDLNGLQSEPRWQLTTGLAVRF
jgi:hypothetical protein